MISRQNKFSSLTFEDFKKMAKDDSLSQFEKIGFPDSYRNGKEEDIFQDIKNKVQYPATLKNGISFDIGCGCSSLPYHLSELCIENNNTLFLIDSAEMLEQLDIQHSLIRKYSGCFPDIHELIKEYQSKVNFILCYSVIQYSFDAGNLWRFVDECLALLAPQGTCILGDIPNESKRKRFFSSQNGIEFHQKFTKTNTLPEVYFNQLEPSQIDDSVVNAIIQRCRSQGFDAYVVPQNVNLPMANRREDIIITRP